MSWKYAIITANNERELEKQVNECLDKGWHLIGGVTTLIHSTKEGGEGRVYTDLLEYAQAMLYREKFSLLELIAKFRKGKK